MAVQKRGLAMDIMSAPSPTPPPPASPKQSLKERFRYLKKIIPGLARVRHIPRAVAVVAVLAFAATLVIWWHFGRQPAVTDPFSAKVLSSETFPLYYPQLLPKGYKINPKVTRPTTGVVVFTASTSKSSGKLYFSEEAVSASTNVNAFYADFSNPKKVTMNGAKIVVGVPIGSRTEVASWANAKTWIIADTNNTILVSQLVSMMDSMKLAYYK